MRRPHSEKMPDFLSRVVSIGVNFHTLQITHESQNLEPINIKTQSFIACQKIYLKCNSNALPLVIERRTTTIT